MQQEDFVYDLLLLSMCMTYYCYQSRNTIALDPTLAILAASHDGIQLANGNCGDIRHNVGNALRIKSVSMLIAYDLLCTKLLAY